MTVQNVIVSLERRARPNKARREAALFDIIQVRNQNVVIDVRAQRAVFARGHGDVIRSEVLDRVQIREVNSSPVRFRALVIILLHINSHQTHIGGLKLLEQEDDARTVSKVRRNALFFEVGVVVRLGVHLFECLRHNTNGQVLSGRDVFYGYAQLLRALHAFRRELRREAFFQKRRHLCLR